MIAWLLVAIVVRLGRQSLFYPFTFNYLIFDEDFAVLGYSVAGCVHVWAIFPLWNLVGHCFCFIIHFSSFFEWCGLRTDGSCLLSLSWGILCLGTGLSFAALDYYLTSMSLPFSYVSDIDTNTVLCSSRRNELVQSKICPTVNIQSSACERVLVRWPEDSRAWTSGESFPGENFYCERWSFIGSSLRLVWLKDMILQFPFGYRTAITWMAVLHDNFSFDFIAGFILGWLSLSWSPCFWQTGFYRNPIDTSIDAIFGLCSTSDSRYRWSEFLFFWRSFRFLRCLRFWAGTDLSWRDNQLMKDCVCIWSERNSCFRN